MARSLGLWVAAAAVLVAPAWAQTPRPARTPPRPPVERAADTRPDGRTALSLEAGNGRVITLPGPATNVFVADPRVAEVRPASTDSLFVFGVAPGRTTIAVMNAEGHPVAQFEVTVRPSTFVATEAEAAVARLMPNSRIRVTPQGRGLLLTGNVDNPADAARAASIMKGFAGEGAIENQLTIQSSIQVNMRVRIVEMSRSVTRALGVNWQAMGSIGRLGTTFASTTGLGAVGGAAVGALGIGTKDVNALVDALATDGLVRILAEPNLTVMSGQAGSFLAGGEFPVPVGQQNGSITVEFKRYGVTLSVVPTVLSDGRINLHINPEVSQLSQQGAVQLTVANSSISVPALTVRRAETSVELGSGQSFAIAGLLLDQSTTNSNGIPFLGELPIIGPLFRSTSFQRQETELVILVTPYVVRPSTDPAALHVPGERYAPPNDFERILLLRQVGAAGTTAPPVRIPGAAGFIVQ